MTTWKARRVGDRILCGRPAPSRGYCSGLIATVDVPTITPPLVALPLGLMEELAGSHVWVPKARTRRHGAQPRNMTVRKRFQSNGVGHHLVISGVGAGLPFWRACPVCHVLAEVSADLLE